MAMKNNFFPKLCLAIWLTIFACLQLSDVRAQDEGARDSVYVAATVLDEKVYLRASNAVDVAQHRVELSAKGFAKWQGESRWRPLVSNVAHLVMSDWARQNDVRPTEAEIHKHFSDEAKQHLGMYATGKQKKQVTLAVELATLSAGEWVRAKALHEKYGGSIALSSFGGWIAIEGRNALLKEYAAAGKIRFHDSEIEQLFWLGIENPAVLDVTVRDPKRIASHFEYPPWQGWGVRTAIKFKENPFLSQTQAAKQDLKTDNDPANKDGEIDET